MCLATCYNKANIINTLNLTFQFEYSLETTNLVDTSFENDKIRNRLQHEFFHILAEEYCQYDYFVSIHSSSVKDKEPKYCSPEVRENNNCQVYFGRLNVNLMPYTSMEDIHRYLNSGMAVLQEEVMRFDSIDGIDKVKVFNSTIGASLINSKYGTSQAQTTDYNDTRSDAFAKAGLSLGILVAFIIVLGLIIKRKSFSKHKRRGSYMNEEIQNARESIDFNSLRVEIDDPYKIHEDEGVAYVTSNVHVCRSDVCLSCKKSVTFEPVADILGEI